MAHPDRAHHQVLADALGITLDKLYLDAAHDEQGRQFAKDAKVVVARHEDHRRAHERMLAQEVRFLASLAAEDAAIHAARLAKEAVAHARVRNRPRPRSRIRRSHAA